MRPERMNMVIDPAFPRILVSNWFFTPVERFILRHQDQVIIKDVFIYTIDFAVSAKVGVFTFATIS
ncbi:hypothetical protein BBI09_18265 [Stutzerimonas xanthomarina]|nr:hypothetical protein BBI09_18265 [Stutzerimonas xanthomarina]